MRRSLTAVALCAAFGLLAACSGKDDGGTVRSEGGGSVSGSGSGSGSGLSGSDLGSQSSDKTVTAAVADYKTWVVGQAAGLRVDAKKFTDAVRAGNVAEAKKQFAPSRIKWEKIEPIAGLVPDIDGSVDARVDDFASPDDPKWTGWHKLEYLLWEKNTTSGGGPLADKLDKDLATLESKIKTVDITPKAVALGAGELIEEVSEGKINGEEDRYSHTDLSDFDANQLGAKQAYGCFRSLVAAKDKALATEIDNGFRAVEESLEPYEISEGVFKPYTDLKPADKAKMQGQLAALSESLAKVPAAIGVA
ncbi:MAG TPA: iron uptake system protein EfeO [Mycobacteriales bacterium]